MSASSSEEDEEDDSIPDESTGGFFGEGDFFLLAREDESLLLFGDRSFNGELVRFFRPDSLDLRGDLLLLRSTDEELDRLRRLGFFVSGERRLLREETTGELFLARRLERLLERLLERFLLEVYLCFSGEESGLRRRFRRVGDLDLCFFSCSLLYFGWLSLISSFDCFPRMAVGDVSRATADN